MAFSKLITHEELLEIERLELHKVLFLLLLNREEALNEVTSLGEVAEINLLISDFKNDFREINKLLNVVQRRLNSIKNILTKKEENESL